MAQLNEIATVSEHVYRCFKESEFAIFRRFVNWTLLGQSEVPGFTDLVIKIGSLKFMENRPTDPDEIERILKGVQRDVSTARTGRNFTPEVSVRLHPKHYDGLLNWLASRYSSETLLNEARRKENPTWPRAEGVPEATLVAHPFDVLDPLTAFSLPDWVVPFPKRTGHYIAHLLDQVVEWREHVKTPWTKEESAYSDQRGPRRDHVLPCCLAPDCPRGPSYVVAERLDNAVTASQDSGSAMLVTN